MRKVASWENQGVHIRSTIKDQSVPERPDEVAKTDVDSIITNN